MINNQGALYFGAGIDMTQWRQNVNEMRRDILGLSQNTAQQTKQMDTSFRNLGMGLATYFSGAALGNFANQIINVRGEFQKTEIAFGTMLKSTDKAKELMGQMVELAAKTPFSLQDVSAGAKQLLAFQVPAEQVVDTLTRMGNIAAGLGVPLSRINLVYGQVMAKGKLMGDDLRQFTEAGIPMVAELAKKFNTSTSAITEMVSAGKIGFKDVQDVLFSMTNEGGMFFNLMEKQSKSLSGQVANLGDAWDQMLNKIGESNEGILSDSIAATTYLVENYQTVIEVIGVAVASYGAYRAALIATAAWQQLSAGAALQQALAQGTLTTAQAYGAAATVALQRAQIGLNAAMMANPIGIIIGLVAGLTYVIYKNITATTQWEELQNKLNETQQRGIDTANEQQSKINALIGVIRNKNVSDQQAAKALKEINTITGHRINGLTLEGIRLGKNTNAISAYIEMLKKEAKAKALIESITLAEKDNERINRDDPNRLTWGERIGNFDNINDIGKTAQERKAEAMLRDRLANNKMIREGNKELQKLAAEGVNITEQSGSEAEAAINNNTEETKKAVKKQNDEVEKIYGENTIKGLQQRIQKFQEIMETSAFGSEKYNNAKSQKTALEARLKEMTSSFEEQISEIERQWENYYKLSEFYGKDVAYAQYKDLINGSNSYLAYLEKEQEALQNKTGILSDEDKKALIFLTEKINGLTGAKTPLQNWKDDINEALRGVVSLTEQLKILEQKEEEIFASEGGNTSNFLAFKRENDAQMETIKNQIKDSYQSFLAEHQSFEEKKTAITKKYDDLRALATTEKERAKIDKAENLERGALDIEMIKKSAEWEVAFGEMEGMTNTSLQLILSRLLEFKEKSKGTLSLQDSAELEKAILRVQNAANRNPFAKITSTFSNYRTSLKESKVAQEEYNKVLEQTSEDAEKVAKAGEKMVLADKKAAEAKQALITKLQQGQDVFNAVVSGVKELGDAFGGMSDATKDSLEDLSAIGNAAFDFAKSIASGDIAGMISAGIKLIGSIAKAISGDKKKEREIKRQAAYLKELETAYNNLAFAAERAFGAQKYDGQRELIKNLQQQKAIILEMLRIEESKKKTDKEKVAQYNSQIQQINQSIEELKEGIIKDVLQTDIPDMAAKMGDAIFQAFEQGASGIDAINNAFNDLIKNMLKNQLNKILEKQMEGLMPNILKAMGFDKDGNGTFNGLTQAEIDALRAQMQAATAQGQQFIDAYAQIFEGLGINGLDAQGLKGDIKGVTEKTAGALESQINAMRINQVLHLEAVRNSLLELHQIELNTRNLHQMRKDLAELNYKTKNQLAGVP